MGQKDQRNVSIQESSSKSGEFIFPNNDRYKGEVRINDEGVIERHGFGTHTTSTGIIYTGNWENDKMNGKGRIAFPSGASYEGEFNNNQYEGQGVYSWSNSCVYKGSFVGNKLQGQGVFCDSNSQTWTGQFHFKAAPGLKFMLNL